MGQQTYFLLFLLALMPSSQASYIKSLFDNNVNIVGCLNNFNVIWNYINEGSEDYNIDDPSEMISSVTSLIDNIPVLAADCGFSINFDVKTNGSIAICYQKIDELNKAYSQIVKDGKIQFNVLNQMIRALPDDLTEIYYRCTDLLDVPPVPADDKNKTNDRCLDESDYWLTGLYEARDHIENSEFNQALDDISGLIEAIPIILKDCSSSGKVVMESTPDQASCFSVIQVMYQDHSQDVQSYTDTITKIRTDFLRFYKFCHGL